ncbi:hypothetical protein [Cryptosporangium japonicum]|uniref:Uncharacterized protein n=1 Tax=Cryptosporangium japonicum TaxID=80872 RepID=A0ABP3EVQ4_9ACTN
MSLKHLIAHWDEDLPHLDAEALQERWTLAQNRENEADAPGTGRNPKARRDWRKRRQAVEAELERRGLEF